MCNSTSSWPLIYFVFCHTRGAAKDWAQLQALLPSQLASYSNIFIASVCRIANARVCNQLCTCSLMTYQQKLLQWNGGVNCSLYAWSLAIASYIVSNTDQTHMKQNYNVHQEKPLHASQSKHHDGILSRRYSSMAPVPLVRMAARGIRKGFPPSWRCLKKKSQMVTRSASFESRIGLLQRCYSSKPRRDL